MGTGQIRQNKSEEQDNQLATMLLAHQIKSAVTECQFASTGSQRVKRIELEIFQEERKNQLAFSMCGIGLSEEGSTQRHRIVVNYNKIRSKEPDNEKAQNVFNLLQPVIDKQLEDLFLAHPIIVKQIDSLLVQTRFGRVRDLAYERFLESLLQFSKFIEEDMVLMSEACGLFQHQIKPKIKGELESIIEELNEQIKFIQGLLKYNVECLVKELNQKLIDIAKYNVIKEKINLLDPKKYYLYLVENFTTPLLGYINYPLQERCYKIIQEHAFPQVDADFNAIQKQIMIICHKGEANIESLDQYYTNWKSNWSRFEGDGLSQAATVNKNLTNTHGSLQDISYQTQPVKITPKKQKIFLRPLQKDLSMSVEQNILNIDQKQRGEVNCIKEQKKKSTQSSSKEEANMNLDEDQLEIYPQNFDQNDIVEHVNTIDNKQQDDLREQ